ncbi:Fc.00g097200.m01.CDS01 [Cosmosporella sp. VM-42]
MADGYATKGLPPPPSISKTTIPMAGLLVDVYGLDELPAGVLVDCLWLLHPRTRTRARMSDIACRTIAAWNVHPSSSSRGLIALAFDMPNHGTRHIGEKSTLAWDGGNDNHAIDMMAMVKGGVSDMSGLMDLVEGYLGRRVDRHACLGWSLGGHSAWQAWFGEKRIEAAVVIVGCPDFMGLMSDRAKTANLDCGDAFFCSNYFPRSLVDTCLRVDPKGYLFGALPIPDLPLSTSEKARLRPILDEKIMKKKLLLCSGEDDNLVPYANSTPILNFLKDAVEGWHKEGGVVMEDRIYAGVGHRFSKGMVEDAVRFLVGVMEDRLCEKEEKGQASERPKI